MTVPLTGAGSLPVRLGHLFGALADEVALMGGSATSRVLSGANMVSREATWQSDYGAGTADLELINGDTGFGANATPLYQSVNTWQTAQQQLFNDIRMIATNTLIKMCDRDAGGLKNRTLAGAMAYLAAQMAANSTSFNATTVSLGSQTAVGSPTGNPVIVLSEKNGAGAVQQYMWSETLGIATTADAQTGSQTAGQEQLTFTGAAAVANPWSYLWPGGSGVGKVINLCNPVVNNSGANPNLLTNGSWASFSGASANYPDNFVALVGTVGTQILKSTGTVYFGSNSLEFVGDSSTLTSVCQPFNTAASATNGAGGTPAKLVPQTPYALVLWYKLSAGAPAAGVLKMDLVDGSNSTISDSASTVNSATVNLNGVADTNWHTLTLVGRLPAVLPATVKLRLSLSTALTTGTNLFIGGVACNPMTQLYAGGPYCSPFSGNTNTILGDSWTMAVTPTWGVLQQWFERVFGMKALGLQIPGSGSPTVADSVVA